MTFTATTIGNDFRRTDQTMESFDAPIGKCQWCQEESQPVKPMDTIRTVYFDGKLARCESRLTICARCAWVMRAEDVK